MILFNLISSRSVSSKLSATGPLRQQYEHDAEHPSSGPPDQRKSLLTESALPCGPRCSAQVLPLQTATPPLSSFGRPARSRRESSECPRREASGFYQSRHEPEVRSLVRDHRILSFSTLGGL